MVKREKRKPWIRWVLLALSLVALFFFVWGRISLFKLMDLRREQHALRTRIDSLTTRVSELEIQKQRLLTDSAYLEKLARQETGMAKPKEKVYRFVAPANPDESTNTLQR